MLRARIKRPGGAPKLSFTGWKGYVEALGAAAVCTLVSWLLHPPLASASLGLIFLAGVLIAALRGGVGPALLASIVSFLMFNLLFTEPQFTFYVMHRQDMLMLAIFLLVAVVTGQLAARVRHQLEEIRRSNRRISLLEDFSRRLTGTVNQADFARVLTEYLESLLGARSVVLKRGYDAKLVTLAGDPGRSGLTDRETAAAEWAFEHRENAGCGTPTFPDSYWLFVPIYGKEGSMAVLGVATKAHGSRLDRDQQRILFAMRDQSTIALERLVLAAEMERNRLLIETDKLRSALLSSVSHDLRTPLVSIKGTASALLELGDALVPGDQRELLENLLAEGERMNRYVQNLLEMTRLGYGGVKPHLDWSDVRDVTAAAVRSLKRSLGTRSVQVSVDPGVSWSTRTANCWNRFWRRLQRWMPAPATT
jgi:two-component system sensor histidine kinase KdpD